MILFDDPMPAGLFLLATLAGLGLWTRTWQAFRLWRRPA